MVLFPHYVFSIMELSRAPLSIFLLSILNVVFLFYCYAECSYAKCYAECYNAECRVDWGTFSKDLLLKWRLHRRQNSSCHRSCLQWRFQKIDFSFKSCR
jgi:hypothetical protein